MNKKILIVKKYIDWAQLLEKKLKPIGFEIYSANKPEEVITSSSNRELNLLIAELALPNIDGLTLAMSMKESNSFLKVIILSSINKRYLSKEDLQVCEQYVDEFIEIPTGIGRIIDLIRIHIA